MTSPDPVSINAIPSNVLSPTVQDPQQVQVQQPAAKLANDAKPAQNQQSSTVVNLSAEGQQLSRSDANSSPSSSSASNGPPAKGTAEPTGIQFMASESTSGRVSTSA
jgi:hypothetical protein